MSGRAFSCQTERFCIASSILFRAMHFCVEPGFFVWNKCYNAYTLPFTWFHWLTKVYSSRRRRIHLRVKHRHFIRIKALNLQNSTHNTHLVCVKSWGISAVYSVIVIYEDRYIEWKITNDITQIYRAPMCAIFGTQYEESTWSITVFNCKNNPKHRKPLD